MESAWRMLVRLLVALVAVGLVAVGRLALAYQPWLDWLLGWLHLRNKPLLRTWFNLFPDVVGPADVVSLAVLASGCTLLAFALPKPTVETASRPPIQPRPASPGARRVVWALLLLAAGMTATAARLLRQPQRPAASVALWLASLLAAGLAAWAADRAAGTPFGNPLPARRDWVAVASLAVLDLALVGHDVGHWRWIGTPDEGNFYPFAEAIARGRSEHFVLSETGMYGVHPLLSSYYQAAFMRLFGVDVFGWRLSSAAALAGSLPFVYVLGRELWSRRFGLWAAVLFGTTPLAVGFAHFGYNNTQVYPFVAAAPALLLWAMRRRSALGYYLAGAVAGLSAFTFYPARMTLPLLFLVAFAVRERPWARAVRRHWALLLLAAAIGATPILVHPLDSLRRMSGQTAFRPQAAEQAASPSEGVAAASAGKVVRLAQHWAMSTFHPLWHPRPSHFQTASVVDPLQGLLAIIGLMLAWRGWRRRAACRFLALAYPLMALAVGSVSQHDCPPLTRLLFLCPFTSMLAALALEQLVAPLDLSPRRPRVATALGTLLVACASLWGTAILRYSVYVRHHGYGEGTTSEVVRLLQSLPADWVVIYVQRSPTYMQGADNAAAAYGNAHRLVYLHDSAEIAKHLPEAGESGFVFVHDLPSGPSRERVEAVMEERFPGRSWRETAPGQRWNLRALAVGEAGDGGWEPLRLPERSGLGQLVLGHLDW